jgi:2-polyprenyl-6-methoxyphenol hydroxylase-like FAD-dependent oxidoreductase
MAISTSVLVIGGGMAGTLAAYALGKQGLNVVLVDTRELMSPVFKAEKVGPQSVPQLKRLGLRGAIEAIGRSLDQTIDAANGRVMRRMHLGEYGFYYHDFVNQVRKRLPPTVNFKRGSVRTLSTGPDVQRVHLVDGEEIISRLAVLACGSKSHLFRQLGIARAPILKEPAIGFGCRLVPADGGKFWFDDLSITYYPNDARHRLAYCTLFSVPDGMRLNMFGFHEIKTPWVCEFQTDPYGKLVQVFPKLTQLIGDFRVATKIETMSVRVNAAINYVMPGVALIGDAFSTVPPSTGMGVGKLMHDVELLAGIVPGWLSTPGMGTEKIKSFYEHPLKREVDAKAREKTHYQHWAATSSTLRARIHRWKLFASAHIMQIVAYSADPR